MQTPVVSLVIRAFNEEQYLGRLLSSVAAQTIKDVEIILVDSGSTDNTLAVARQHPVKVVHIDPAEFTFGRSLNLGISHASADLVAIASAHVYPSSRDWLEKLIAPFDNPQIALSYGAQRGEGATKFSEHQHFQEWFPDASDPEQSRPFCNNANAAIRRSLWDLHPYDETLTGLEDIAWASWAVEQGYRLAYVAEAAVVHVHDETPRQIYNRYLRESIALKRILPRSRFTLRFFLTHFLRYAAKDALAALRQRVFLRHFFSILQFRLLQYWGTYRGYQFPGPLTEELKHTFYYSPKHLGPHPAPTPSLSYNKPTDQP